jgi:N-acetylglucosaminyl-diphospho-decaprenol L-rhamnosyltransferase
VPRFSAVIVTHNSAPELEGLLDSLERRLCEPPQTIVVDTASSDETLAVAHGRAETVDLGGNPGFGAAANAGLERARAEVTVLLNPDLTLLDAGLATLAERARDRRALLAPRLLTPSGRLERSAHPLPGRPGGLLGALVHPRALPRSLRLRLDPWRDSAPRPVGWAVAACLAARTDLLRALGPFDPAQFLFYEDMDLCLRARAAGVPTELHPDVKLIHAGAHSTAPAFAGEPHELLARRRREVVAARLGPRAAALDDLTLGLTYLTRAAARVLLRRDSGRQRAQLAGLLAARRWGRGRGALGGRPTK